MEGKNKCDWSSCREGCTKVVNDNSCYEVIIVILKNQEVFDCWKIRVKYFTNSSSKGETESEGRLFPNVYGCGYPPR